MENFKKKCLLEKRRMLIEDLVKYYADYRIYCYNRGDKLKGIEFRKKIHPLINLILKIDQILSKEKIIVISDRSNIRSNEPKIFACTHIGGNDIQRTFQIINAPAYFQTLFITFFLFFSDFLPIKMHFLHQIQYYQDVRKHPQI